MAKQVEPGILKEFTATHQHLAVAECVPNLSCVIYGDGDELGPWTNNHLPEELEKFRTGGKITSADSEFLYWILNWNGARAFEIAEGPLNADELVERINRVRSASA